MFYNVRFLPHLTILFWSKTKTAFKLKNIYIYIAACENQGKQHELSDHWKSIKTLILKTGDD